RHGSVDFSFAVRYYPMWRCSPCLILLFCSSCAVQMQSTGDLTFDDQFLELSKSYLDRFTALSPVYATYLGDHRYDGELDEVGAESRARTKAFSREYLELLKALPREHLSQANQIDAALLEHDLRKTLWRLDVLQEWAWNPLGYTDLCGRAIYSLMARDFAPLAERLSSAADRLEKLPRLLEQVRGTLVAKRVPKIHAETAVKQNKGVLSILDNMVVPNLGKLEKAERGRLEAAMKTARAAVDKHQEWLEKEVLPQASGDFRIGKELFDKKLAFTLNSPLSRAEIRKRAESELKRVREQMYEISKGVHLKKHPQHQFPAQPDEAHKQETIQGALELAYADKPARDAVVKTAKESLVDIEAFVRKRDLITIPDDPIEIIIMPEFERGVSVAYCDSPGALDVGQKTFYAVAPLPDDWTDKQVDSFLREYNRRSIHNLSVHEAIPGHFLQLAHSNRYPSLLRAVLSSGVFIEGWAVYTEQMLADEGYMNADPLMKLIALKWYLRGIANSIIDQAIHAGGMSEEEAMRLMTGTTFQEEREAAGKWIRAQLTSTQLSTYFVGYQEHRDLRAEVEKKKGDAFNLKKYHDQVISYGSPPVRFVRRLVLGLPVAD
ncbi:MAG: DUF885 domain-containing protein, partial [Planctomycetes bacterium]|nr:DUF885 domain-containing protein [Planctomycetota bacterium]